MDLNDLDLFVAVAEASSFSGAAKKLGLPKSSVSRGIARLEGELGVRLVQRTTRQVSLSSAGAALHERVAPQLAQLKKAVGDLPEAEEKPSGHLRISAAVDFGITLLPELLSTFVSRCPSVSVEVNVSNKVVDLVADRYDLAFRATGGRLKDSSLVAKRAGPVVLQLVASPSYLARRGTPRVPADLATHEWVLFRKAGKLRLEGPGGETADFEPSGRLAGDEMFFIKEAVRAGAGIGMLPTFLLERELASGALVRVLPRWIFPTGALWIVTPGGDHLPKKTAAFREFAIEYLRTRMGV
jgi:DNA-binding transcriptional LysR family regulator